MVLHPLEFSDCFLDPPWFRQSIKEHEDELEHTNTQIKQLIKDAKAMLLACRKQGEMMFAFSERLKNFQFEIIGDNLTDAERGIAGSLKEFGSMLEEIESEWKNTIERSEIQLIQPLERFRKEHIHSYREAKKTFDKSSDRYYKQMEQTLGLSHKKKEQQLTDSDNELLVQKRNFHQSSLEYVYKLQEVQERKKFEFVEHLLMFMQVYFNFFRQTHETAVDCKEYMNEIQQRLISTRNQYEGTRNKTQTLMKKMMDDPSGSTKKGSQTHSPQRVIGQRWARAGYLYLLEKNPLGARFTAKWTRFFCMYTKENKLFQMLSTSSHASSHATGAPVKIGSSNHLAFSGDPLIVLSCTRKQTESIDKRFCFDIEVEDSAGKLSAFTLQALSMSDRKKWIGAMDGKEPNYISAREYRKPEEFTLNETSIKFVKDVIAEIERRGIDAEGIYRLVGVSSKVDRILQIAMDPLTYGMVVYSDDVEWELNTLTSALKNFFRNLPEPIMTFDLHEDFIAAAKREDPDERLNRVIMLIKKLAPDSKLVLELLIHHLVNVAARWETNKMTVQNIGVCFGPTLMRPKQETVQSIMEIKFNNIIVEILIENCDAIFGSANGENAKQEKRAISHRPIDSRPSMKFKSRPKTVQRRTRSPFQETITEDVLAVPRQGGGGVSPRFQRGHAIRGVPGRSTVQKPPDQNSDNNEEVLSDNTDEFGRISPLDLNLDFEHFSLNPSPPYVNIQPKTQPINPPMEERVKKEEWDLDKGGKSFSARREPFRRNIKLSQSDRMANTGHNANQNNSSHRQNNTGSTIEEAKEMLLRDVAPMKQALLSKKRSVVRRVSPLQSKKPQEYVNHSVRAERPAGIANFEKLRETFSKGEHSNEEKVGCAGDHDASFLWPKPGGIRGNSYVEANSVIETRPRSTVVSSREEAKSSSAPQTPDDSEKRVLSAPVTPIKSKNRTCEALYSCEAGHDTELSFQQGDTIFNVSQSEEPGWLLGTLNGCRGLIPENYVREKLWE